MPLPGRTVEFRLVLRKRGRPFFTFFLFLFSIRRKDRSAHPDNARPIDSGRLAHVFLHLLDVRQHSMRAARHGRLHNFKNLHVCMLQLRDDALVCMIFFLVVTVVLKGEGGTFIVVQPWRSCASERCA